jgi:hypothetical protein
MTTRTLDYIIISILAVNLTCLVVVVRQHIRIRACIKRIRQMQQRLYWVDPSDD